MKKLSRAILGVALLLPVVALAGPPVPVQAPTQAPAKAVQAPAVQAPTQAPVKTAQVNNGYRTYSYMPGTVPANNYYYNNQRSREPGFFSGHQRADYKVKGEFWAR
jgi:hypothetical protein